MHRLALLALLLVTLPSCGREKSIVTPRDVPPQLSPTLSVVEKGGEVQFQTFGVDRRAVGWSVRQGLRHGLISPDGHFQAPYFDSGVAKVNVDATTPAGVVSATVVLSTAGSDTANCLGPSQIRLPAPDEYVFVDELPEAVLKVSPSYPDSAREAGVDGQVVVQALVCANGHVIDVRIARSIPLLDRAASDAARWWTFKPARIGGRPLAVWVAIPFKFTLHEPR